MTPRNPSYMAGDCSFTIACHVDSEFMTLKITLTTGDFLMVKKCQILVHLTQRLLNLLSAYLNGYITIQTLKC